MIELFILAFGAIVTFLTGYGVSRAVSSNRLLPASTSLELPPGPVYDITGTVLDDNLHGRPVALEMLQSRLPNVPKGSLAYDPWFAEMNRRVLRASIDLSATEQLQVMDGLIASHSRYLDQILEKRERIAKKVTIDTFEIPFEEHGLALETAKIRAEIEKLINPPKPPSLPAPKSLYETAKETAARKAQRAMSVLETIAALEKEEGDMLKRYPKENYKAIKDHFRTMIEELKEEL